MHSHDLAAVDAEAHVSARQHDCVLVGRVADHTLLLTLVLQIGGIVVDSIDVVEVHDLVVVKQFLPNVLVPDVVWAVSLELTVRKLNVPLPTTGVPLRINCFNRNHNWVEILRHTEQVFLTASLHAACALVVF